MVLSSCGTGYALTCVYMSNNYCSCHVYQKAQELGFGQSLFERIYEFLQNPQFPNPVRMLNTQYRMHPDIVAFPNALMYDNRLNTDR